MSFDVPKIFQSPEFDHGHDEESRNGRDIKIDILGDYIRTPEVFRVISEKTGVPEGLPEPPGEVLVLTGPEGRERAAGQAPPLPWGVRIGQGEGGAAPLSLSLSLSFLPPSSFLVGLGMGSPTPTRRRTPPSLARPKGRPASPLAPLYTGARGHPIDTQVDLWIGP